MEICGKKWKQREKERENNVYGETEKCILMQAMGCTRAHCYRPPMVRYAIIKLISNQFQPRALYWSPHQVTQHTYTCTRGRASMWFYIAVEAQLCCLLRLYC